MVEMINKTFKTRMFVSEDRVNEYLEAGHLLASAPTAKAADIKPKKPKKTQEKK